MGLRLQDGDRVCVVGGGPAGTSAAIRLLALAAERGLRLEVLIFEPHDPLAGGPRNCKGCAGIISDGALQRLAELDLTVPAPVVQSELTAYVVHLGGQAVTIDQPRPGRHILSVYRGSGPRKHEGGPIASFDGWLLNAARARGARLVPERARRVEWDRGPVVYTDHERYPAQFLVLATGVNSRAPLAPVFGYQAPGTIAMAQDEIPRPQQWPDGKVVGFFGQPAGLLFGALVPKGRYINVSLLWRDSPPDAIERFYAAQHDALARFFPDAPPSLCGCNPRILATPAPVYYGDRWVAVGDAAVARLYKDGINSAIQTAGQAMVTAVEHGIAAADFEAGYRPLCEEIADDNRYGELLYRVCAMAMRAPMMAQASVDRVRAEAQEAPGARPFSRVMWGMLTGDETYRELFRLCLRPGLALTLGRELLRAAGGMVPVPRAVGDR